MANIKAFCLLNSDFVEVLAINKSSPYGAKAIVRMSDGQVKEVNRREIQLPEDKDELLKLNESLRNKEIGENPEYFSSLKYLLKNGSPIVLN
ncbi:hypothetical protein [Paenibacillus tepidiphilus]|uniref:hypothetical protein n=1 Tax=Paenibacillus tepidiphilus TaxID=2608683 RepID=UPI0012398AFE|nr:hypothetical protein [Paenibacillus tepidiphilus]